MIKKALQVSLIFWTTVSFALYGQQDSSIVNIPSYWFPVSKYVIKPIALSSNNLIMPADSSTYESRGLIKLPFIVIKKTEVAKDWSAIELKGIIQGKSYSVPFIAPVEWYFDKRIQINRKIALTKTINDTSRSIVSQSQFLQDNRGSGVEFIGVNVGQLGRVSLSARGNVTVKGNLVFQDQELIRSKVSETRNTHLKFDQMQRISVEGKVGERISVNVDHDSERDFNWENNIRINYKGKEDDIIQSVDAGNVSLSLPGSQSLMGSANHQGLFGVKTTSKFGPMDVTAIASVVNTEKKSEQYKGTSESQTQQIKDYNYVKNQYFFIHEWFRNGTQTTLSGAPVQIPSFYPLKEGLHQIGNVVIRNFELYQLDQSTNSETNPGTAFADLQLPEESNDQTGNFKRLEQGQDYTLSEDLGFIRLRQKATDEVIGCTYVIADRISGDTLYVVGEGVSATNDALKLKMLKPRNLNPSHPVWPLMFKNVYYLGTNNINKEGFDLRIVNDRLTVPSHLNAQGNPYITIFGLDSLNESGIRTADQKIDLTNPNIINLVNGEIFFPAFHPFASDTIVDGNQTAELKGSLGEGMMYFSTQRTQISNDSRFTIEVDYSNQSSTINLGFMIVEGSEQVSRGGVPLKRGIDYQVDYFSGTIVLSDNIDPNAELNVTYDRHQFVNFDKKTILGVRSQMDFGENSFIGGTALYYNQSIMNEKVEVGYEPMRNFMFGVNGRFKQDLPFVTRSVDKMPFIETDKQSGISFEGEFAQILPNPNPISNTATGDPNGVAFIDDFEGSKRTTSIPILRRFWREASAPLDLLTGAPLSQYKRAKLRWFNPFAQIRTKDIWPNLSTSIQAQNETTDILVLRYNKRSHQDAVPNDSLWSGIITPFHSGDYDQTQTKFFEIWLQGEGATVSIDLGQISEDRDGNGALNTEDIPVGGLIGDGILDDEEDVGLDGCSDEYENGWGGCLDPLGASYADYLALGEEIIINANNDILLDDPNDDNWEYVEGSNDYTKINGTENNALDAGRYPDTEDLDRTGFLDRTNDYFTKSFSLSDTTYLAGQTKTKNGELTGWKLYRIPLVDFEATSTIKEKSWDNIHHLRLRLGNTDQTTTVYVAKIELVGNEWQELGIASDTSGVYSKENADSVFAISVINTDDNASYKPPQGVQGEFDRINQIRSKEQSLVMKFNELPSNTSGAAMKTLMSLSGERAQSYLSYDRMKMYVHGSSPWITNEKSDVQMFMRFGFGENYYEISQPVYDGWDESLGRNSVNLDLKWLTALKLQDSTSIKKYNSSDIFRDSTDSKEYLFTDELGIETGKAIKIKGQPSLNRIQYFIVGVKNLSGIPISGEVWLDELRLSGVKRDKGVSMRLQSRFNVADLVNTSFAYRRQDADFHTLQRRLGSNRSNESLNINAGFNLDKLMPSEWGIKVPVSTSFAQAINKPKYLPGQDVLVDQSSPPDSILNINNSLSMNISASKTSKSDNKIIKYSLDKIKTRFSMSRRLASNEIQKEVLNESYSGGLSYALPFGRNNYVMPLKWMSSIPWLGEKLGSTHLYYTPSALNATINYNEQLSQRTPRKGEKSPDDYNFGLSQSYIMDYKLTEMITTKYSRSINSNMAESRGYQLNSIMKGDVGFISDINENFNSSFSPVIFDWLKPSFSYSSNYRWNKSRDKNIEGSNISSQLRLSSGVTLSPTRLVEIFYKPTTATSSPTRKPKRTSSSRARRRVPGKPISEEDTGFDESSQAVEEEKPKKEKKKKENKILNSMYGLTKKFSPINISYNENFNKTGLGVLGETPFAYRLGFERNHGLEHSSQVGSNTGNFDRKRDFSIRSGVSLTRMINVAFNYAQNVSSNLRGSGLEQRSVSRDYLSYGQYLENGFPFVGWSIRLTGLERNKFISKYVNSLSFDHATTGKESRSWQFDQFSGPPISFFAIDDFISAFRENQRTSRVNMNFAPLVGATIALKKGVSINMRHNRTMSKEITANGGQKIFNDQSYLISANYAHKGGFNIPLPFFDNYKVNNQVNFTFNFDMNKNRTLQKAQEAVKFAETTFTTSWKSGFRLTYSFSKSVSGSMVWEYRENDSKHTGKKVDRDFGFDVNLAIRG